MTTQTDIRNALTSAINGASLGVPIMWPNHKNWTTPANQQWIRVSYLFGSKDPLSITHTDQQTVICQIDTFTPKGSGNLSVYSMADKLDALFSKLTPILAAGAKLNVLSTSTSTLTSEDAWHVTAFTATIRVYMTKL